MTDETKTKGPRSSRATRVYGKLFALMGVVAGLALVVFTPVIVTLFHDVNKQWVESMPEWTIPTLLVIGTGGGVLIALVSVVFALLIPSRVEPHDD